MILSLELRSKRLEQRSVIPSRHRIIRSLHAMDESLNSITIIVEQETVSISLDILPLCETSEFAYTVALTS